MSAQHISTGGPDEHGQGRSCAGKGWVVSETDVGMWMPLYIGDYVAATKRLTTEQHGAYLLLIMDYWRNGAPPADDAVLVQITGMDRPSWRRNKATVLAFFEIAEGRLLHRRIEEELAQARRQREARLVRASKGGVARREKLAAAGTASSTPPGGAASGASGASQAALAGCSSPSPSPSPSQRSLQREVLSLPETQLAAGSVPAPPPAASLRIEKPFLSLLTNTGDLFHVDPAYVTRLQGQFPAVDVPQQFRQMQAWLEGNSRYRKTATGMTRFIANWLAREQNRGPQGQNGARGAAQPPPSFIPKGEVM